MDLRGGRTLTGSAVYPVRNAMSMQLVKLVVIRSEVAVREADDNAVEGSRGLFLRRLEPLLQFRHFVVQSLG